MLNDLIDFYFHYTEVINKSSNSVPFLDRPAFYVFFEERKQTHFIVGSIFAIFNIKNKSYFFSILFIKLFNDIPGSITSKKSITAVPDFRTQLPFGQKIPEFVPTKWQGKLNLPYNTPAPTLYSFV